MAQKETISLTVWNVPMPVITGQSFPVKVGAKSSAARALSGVRIEVSDAAGAVVASGAIGNALWAGTEALYWSVLDVPAPRAGQATDFRVRCVPTDTSSEGIASQFSVIATERPECTLSVQITERTRAEPLGGVEIRLGPFRARTDSSGHAELRVSKGEYQLHLWRAAHIASSQAIRIDGDTRVALTMLFVPEEHPDARWVR
jgi:hypothetical protein